MELEAKTLLPNADFTDQSIENLCHRKRKWKLTSCLILTPQKDACQILHHYRNYQISNIKRQSMPLIISFPSRVAQKYPSTPLNTIHSTTVLQASFTALTYTDKNKNYSTSLNYDAQHKAWKRKKTEKKKHNLPIDDEKEKRRRRRYIWGSVARPKTFAPLVKQAPSSDTGYSSERCVVPSMVESIWSWDPMEPSRKA